MSSVTNQTNQNISNPFQNTSEEIAAQEARRTELLKDLAWIDTKQKIQWVALFIIGMAVIALACVYLRKI